MNIVIKRNASRTRNLLGRLLPLRGSAQGRLPVKRPVDRERRRKVEHSV